MQQTVDLITTAIQYAQKEDRKRIAELEAQLEATKKRLPRYRSEAAAKWLESEAFDVYCELKPLVVPVLTLLQDGQISRSKAVEAIAELLKGESPKLPECLGEALPEDLTPHERIAGLESEVAALETALQVAREFISYSPCLCIGGEFPVECRRCDVLARIEEISDGRN